MSEVRPRFHLAFPVPNLQTHGTSSPAFSAARRPSVPVGRLRLWSPISAHSSPMTAEAAVNGVTAPGPHTTLRLDSILQEWERLRDDMECKG